MTYYGQTFNWERYSTYDAENQLVTVEVPGYFKSTFTYDGRGRRRQRTEYTWNGSNWVFSQTINYIYDGRRVIQERDNNGNTPLVSYTRGSDLSGTLEGAGGVGGLLARSHGYSSGSWTTNNFYHADGGGNITYMVNTNQAMVATYRYDPYGNTISSSGALASLNLYRFSSKEVDPNYTDSGLYYYGYRWYDPNLQRWLNRDPLGDDGSMVYASAGIDPTIQLVAIKKLTAGGRDAVSMFASVSANLYRAVGNNPSTFTDAYGLDFSDCWSDCMNGTALPVSVDAAAAANGIGNMCFGRTPRGGIAMPPHPTSWQHRLGSKFGTFGSRIGKFLGRGGVGFTIGVGLYDLCRIAGCAASCGLPGPPADIDPSYMYIQ